MFVNDVPRFSLQFCFIEGSAVIFPSLAVSWSSVIDGTVDFRTCVVHSFMLDSSVPGGYFSPLLSFPHGALSLTALHVRC